MKKTTTGNRINPFVNRQPLHGSGREGFLSRVRKALGHSATLPPAEVPASDDRVLRQVASDDPNRVDRWVQQATGNSIKVTRTNSAGVQAALDAVLSQHTVTRAMVNCRDLGKRFPLPMHLAGKGIVVHQWGEGDCRNDIFSCELSVTDCRAGMADTGSILVWSEAGFGRSSTLVIPVHVVLMGASQVLGDLCDGLAMVQRLNPNGLPSNVVVINGPSKTGDIEMKLVTGVHGPKYVYVIMIEDL